MSPPKFAAAPEAAAGTLVVATPRVVSDPQHSGRSVRSAAATPGKAHKQWRPPEGLSPAEVREVIGAAATERDQLLLRVLWATGGRISEVLALCPMDVLRDSLVLPNRKNPNQTVKRVFLPGAEFGRTGELLLWAKEQGVADDEPLFFSRKRGAMVAVVPCSVGRPGSWSGRRPSARRFACLRSGPRGMAASGNRHPYIRTSFAMPACARSSATHAACRWPNGRLAGRGCSPPT